jgi:phytol kinase
MFNSNWLALLFTFIVAIAWFRFMDFLAHRGILNVLVSRKLIHIGTGPIFVLSWLLFPSDPSARFFAALVPLGITIQFLLVGMGVMKDKASVQAMSRTGNPRELLLGPLFYGIVFILLTILYWRDSPIGITALMLLCGGDGLADVLGNRFGKRRLPWSSDKTWVGSIFMFFGGWLLALIILFAYISFGTLRMTFFNVLLPVTLIAFGGTLVESLPFRDIDNISVPIISVILGNILF